MKKQVTVLSEEGIRELEKLRQQYPQHSDAIDEIIRLSKEGYVEAVGVALILLRLILEGGQE